MNPQQKFPVRLAGTNVACRVFHRYSEGGVTTFSPGRRPLSAGGAEHLREVRLDLINSPDFLALADRSGTRVCEDHVDIAAEGRTIEIRPRKRHDEPRPFRTPLCAVTHSCMMRKQGRAEFGDGEARDCLDTLHDALSFAAGRWVAPIFVRELDSSQQVAWQEWGPRPLHPDLDQSDTWSDGPKALSVIRSRLVHPGKSEPLPYYDAWKLAAWYLELVLLRVVGFSGEYSNRTSASRRVGQVEPVPWATSR